MQTYVVVVVWYWMMKRIKQEGWALSKKERIAALKELMKHYKRERYYPEYYDAKGKLLELEGHW